MCERFDNVCISLLHVHYTLYLRVYVKNFIVSVQNKGQGYCYIPKLEQLCRTFVLMALSHIKSAISQRSPGYMAM